MSGRQQIPPIRRAYNRFVADETLEDYALRFTAKKARRWSSLQVAQTALGSLSFLALEAIGGTLVLATGFTNTVTAVLFVGVLIFATAVPISLYAARYGVDIDLLTRGAGFGYLGSTITSLIYASFTFLFFAIEASIMALALQLCLGLPLGIGYVVSAVVVIPLVVYGISLISRFQIWTQPLWIALNLLPLGFIAWKGGPALSDLLSYPGASEAVGSISTVLGYPISGFDLAQFGLASGILLALLAQIGEQVDFLRFVPPAETSESGSNPRWWLAVLGAGAGWILPGMFKMMLGAFLAVLALGQGVPHEQAAEPTQMYVVAFGYVMPSREGAVLLTGLFVVISQLKINVTNAYAGSIAWSNFFSRLTHSHPGRVVWLVFNVAIALLLMELGIDKTLVSTLSLYAVVVSAWVGALAADLAVNKPLGLSPPGIEFKRAHLYAVNPVGTGASALALLAGFLAHAGLLGAGLQNFAPLLSLVTAFAAAPAIAFATGGRYYLARPAIADWGGRPEIQCTVCEHPFEGEDMSHCPAYAGPICSLCCSLDARCGDLCKPHGRLEAQAQSALTRIMPARTAAWIGAPLGRYLALMLTLVSVIGLILGIVHAGIAAAQPEHGETLRAALTSVFFILVVILGIVAWLFVLAQESRRVAQEETARQTALYEAEIEAHKITDAKLQQAKETAEAANLAKSRYVVGMSHELRTPLNAVLGYAQLLEGDDGIPMARRNGIRVIRRSAQHLSGLIDGLLDISRMEAGRLQIHRNEFRLVDFLDQIVDMVRLQANAAGLEFRFSRPPMLPAVVAADEKRLRQILLNLLSNAIKFTENGWVALEMSYRSQVAVFSIRDSGLGIPEGDLQRIFGPFERGSLPAARNTPGTGLGLTIAHLLAQVMGGEITVTSEVGRGTCFSLRLMLASMHRPAGPRPVEAPEPAGGHRQARPAHDGPPRVVLVADDDSAHRALMRDVLEPLGLVVLESPDGPHCLAQAMERRPDIILLDIAMPGMSGWAVAKALRDGGLSSRIAIMSANVHEISPIRGDDAPHDEIIPKPFDLRDFLERIERLLALGQPAPPPPAVAQVSPRSGNGGESLRQDHIAELIRLGRIGHVRGIEAKLAELEDQTAIPAEIAAQMRGLVASYDLRRYVRVLEGMRDG
ncbi:ATP-binding protein [Methylobacterium sp. E-045]|uniref:hybrid sensor histidine kinase/response regulator n=1 Tax=Methylobacterium sp. E-045 TaxID=2836575 RepID=UPI001FBB076A|nr:ATP-binding protein [Methylobacterium sp. E-045]MCJ2130952.1 ATP-binding protein [Methylobacterium sp. E-045]